MKREYEYGFIDGSIVLSRNFYAMKPILSSDKVGPEKLVASVLQSIFKIAREKLRCERYFILWDKKPYYKTKYLIQDTGTSEYKTDRRQESDYLVKKMGNAKYILLCEAGNIGLTSIQFKGWEADDLAYLASCQCIGRNKKSVIISFDSDWESWLGPNTDYYNLRRDEITTYEQTLKWHKPIEGYSVFQSKAFRDSMRGSHNNLKQTLKSEYKSVSSAVIIRAFERGDYKYFSNVELFKAQLRTFDITSYPDYENVSQFLKRVENEGSLLDLDGFRIIRERMHMIPSQLSTKLYLSFVNSVNPRKWNMGGQK